jgi:hypothetical protein
MKYAYDRFEMETCFHELEHAAVIGAVQLIKSDVASECLMIGKKKAIINLASTPQ